MKNKYSYPAAEVITDQLELAMDPYKLARERLSIACAIQFEWETALDLGCGIGRYFDTVFQTACAGGGASGRKLFGVEPDALRRMQAQSAAEATTLAGLETKIVASTDELPAGVKFDLILCTQVLGHLTKIQCDQLLNTGRGLLRDGGVMLCSVPVVTRAGVAALALHGHDPSDDYYFSAKLDVSPFHPDYARPLSLMQYESLVVDGAAGYLPVRCFNVGDVLIRSEACCPVNVPTWPMSLARYLVAKPAYAQIYSFHRLADDQETVLLGDAIFRL
ncbi:class I SAM-dependent methyltransferase [Comamonas sp. lk]|uniref:class I SAM-dependent methyltransferase n=1 Tax=Comamonas sp. lk TaxID=2201272 RepID=UPI000EB5814B|nr:class I SAM-dependent methyltransferase [Comamonas sp. lk]